MEVKNGWWLTRIPKKNGYVVYKKDDYREFVATSLNEALETVKEIINIIESRKKIKQNESSKCNR